METLEGTSSPRVGFELSGAKADLVVVAAVLLGFVALLSVRAVRIGDGSEYYAMFLAWRETLHPYMSAQSWEAYGSLVASGRILDLVPLAVLRDAFPLLHRGATSDFNHFWFFSGVAAAVSGVATMVGLRLSQHAAFIVTHAALLSVVLVTARRCYGWMGLLVAVGLAALSPIVWYLDKVHTEFFTYCLTLTATILVMRRGYLAAAPFLAAASTQNPSFAAVALIVLVLDLVRRKGRSYSLRETVLISLTVVLIFLHPTYYFFRLGVLTPQLLAGGAEIGAQWRIWYVWLLDPDIGLLPNWPAGVLMIALAAWLTRGKPSIFEDRKAWWVYASMYVVISLAAQVSTQNVNSGATPGLARYGLWYIPLFFPAALLVVEQWRRSRAAVVCGATLLGLMAITNLALNRPQLGESYAKPSVPSWIIQKYLPRLYDPYWEIFAERYSGVGEAVWQHSVLGIVGPDCHKVLLIHELKAKEVLGGRSCTLDPILVAPILRHQIEESHALGRTHSYVRLSERDVQGARLRCARRFDFTLNGNLPTMAVTGFSYAEGHGRWSDAREGSFACFWPEDGGAKPARIRIIAHGFVWGGRMQRMRVAIGRGAPQTFEFTDPNEPKSIDLPVPQDDSPTMSIHFEFPDAISPRALGLSGDPRRLGVGISAIEFHR